MLDIKVDYVEVGFRFLDKKKTKGPCAYTTENYLKTLNIPKKLKLAVMINASDFIMEPLKQKLLVDKTFLSKKKSPIKLVRIACHFDEINKIQNIVKILNYKGYEVAINMMQISEQRNEEILKILEVIKKMKIKTLYFADSLGSLNPRDTEKIINTLKKKWKGNIGIHTHDNIGKALENSIKAIKNGVNWVDTTVTGMGRGPGNTKTEIAIMEFKKFQKKKINQIPLLNLINKYFKKMKDKYNWGTNTYYHLAGKMGVHPTFIQEMIGDPTFKPERIISNIKYLSKIGGKKFKPNLININNNLYKSEDKGDWTPNIILKNKKILILGPGINLKKSKKEIIKFIQKHKPYVLSINFESHIPQKFINTYIACHPLRLLVDLQRKEKRLRPIILPLNRLKDLIHDHKNNNMKFLNFGLKVKKNIFKIYDQSAVIPNSLGISYALAVANSGKVSKIYLAGFDGYSIDNPKRIIVQETLDIYKQNNKLKKINFLTSTNYE